MPDHSTIMDSPPAQPVLTSFPNLLSLPDLVAQHLAPWCDRAKSALGDALVSLVLYGGLAKGEYVTGRSDVNLLLVLSRIDAELLDRLTPLASQGVRDFRLALFVLTEQDVVRSADVFPTKFLDIQRHHRLLWGKPVVSLLTIDREHLRLRCEQEVRNLSLRLRQLYLSRSHHPEQLAPTLKDALSSFLVAIATAVELATGKAPASKQETLKALPSLGLDPAPALVLWDKAFPKEDFSPADLKRLYTDFMQLVQAAADVVDRLSA
jgi:predicted nucleotidyltransferase